MNFVKLRENAATLMRATPINNDLKTIIYDALSRGREEIIFLPDPLLFKLLRAIEWSLAGRGFFMMKYMTVSQITNKSNTKHLGYLELNREKRSMEKI